LLEVLTGWLLGILLGMRHALEPDHLAAVSTLVTAERSPTRGALLGAFWGLGHSLALLVVGVSLALLHAEMPGRLADGFELAVAAMLILLGLRAIARARHAHDHPHPHDRERDHHHPRRLGTRPLVVGIVHGLAGSGALTALVVASLPSTASRLAYIGLFGLGSVMGMAFLSGLAGLPLAAVQRRPRAGRWVSAAAGLLSAGLGVAWGWPLVGRLIG
jgi:threonine/homoserine/homoserine lactone efflux protein